ncbi:MAG: type II toxin-antitoxin system VapC family toxin [Anaerolineae bacterium]|nr:type II toxin-antitoxin system VapC family toxin [Anaerolineae bacterium]
MNVYFDTSALIKRYIREPQTPQVQEVIDSATRSVTVITTKAEMAGALGRAVRAQRLPSGIARGAWELFCRHWPTLHRVQVAEALVTHAGELALMYGLRGYDAVHLATALYWQTLLGMPVTMVTYDRLLWHTSQTVGLKVWPQTWL